MDKAQALQTALATTIGELEILRKKIVSQKYKGWGAFLLGVLTLVVLINFGQLIVGIVLGSVAIIYGIVLLYRIINEERIYRARFKQEILGAALSTVHDSLTLSPTRGIPEEEFINSQLFTRTPDRYTTEDLVCGKSGQTSFYFAEVHAEYKVETQTKNGKRVTWHDILKGIVFVADFNKHFNGITVVRPKDFSASIGAWFTKNIYAFGNKNLVELENEDFNKAFITYSTDQIEARYILTPAMMERIIDLNQRSAYTISLSFNSSNLYIAFPLDQNYFEPPLFKSLTKPDLLEQDLAVLNFMVDIVRELDLNTRIWTKQ